MNICFLSREYPPDTHIGGIGTYTYNMAAELSEVGHNIHVITLAKGSEKTFQHNGVWVHGIKNRNNIPRELWYFYYSYLVAKRISRINCQFDIVQSSEFGNEAFWVAQNKKIPLITRLATPLQISDKLDGMSFFRLRPLLYLMEKKQTLLSDGIFTSTRALAKAVADKWQVKLSRIQIIPNSVGISRIMKFGENGSVPNLLRNKDYLLYFGRLEERKGVRVLARALPTVFNRFPSLSMVFVGSDFGHRGFSMKRYIKKKAGTYQKRIIFIDNLPHKELFPIVKAARLVILPSLWEAFGFVCVEAMALGRPVVATSGSGFEEIIEDNVSGYLVKPGDSRLLAEKIISCLKNAESLRQVSGGALKRARDFEVSKVAVKLLAYYGSVIKEWGENNRKQLH